ncbi:MAG TPA: TRAM domain-containing protein [Candidatus Limnocylindria bacterium]|nr:TRAM domain-containing protein [Candidatus Limnocylindria bacterium]
MIDFLQLLLLIFIAAVLWSQQTGRNFLPAKKKGRRVILDTCALIDGRIVELSRAGFVPDELIIPEFILHELQLLADGTDSHKRTRARYGLDIVHEIQQEEGFTVTIDRTQIPDKHAIDDKLIALAKKLDTPLYTTDYNLGKVADIEGVKVLNVNELAQHLRPTALPGETRTIKIIQKGSNPKQGAGYTGDGTLIVVEDAARYIGKEVEVEITKSHQTAAGKMLFGELVHRGTAQQKAVPAATTHKRSNAAVPATRRMLSKTTGPRLAARRSSRNLAARLKRG